MRTTEGKIFVIIKYNMLYMAHKMMEIRLQLKKKFIVDSEYEFFVNIKVIWI